MRSKIFKYILFFIPTFLTVSSIWTFFISANLFYCSDWVPYLDFIPPFSDGPQYGDYFIVDQKIVWTLWFFLIALIFLLPYYFAQLWGRKKDEGSRTEKHTK